MCRSIVMYGIIVVGLVTLVRIIHRVYYFLTGHIQLFSFDPRTELTNFLNDHDIPMTRHALLSSADGETLTYKRVGRGSRFILLTNGVGTDFFMWLPILQFVVKYDCAFFQNNTLIVQSYRGLFAPTGNIEAITESTEYHTDGVPSSAAVTIGKCVKDVLDMMEHAGIIKYDAIFGWSTGAQVATVACALHPHICENLFLLNVSLGSTLHTVFQPIVAMPVWIQRKLSGFLLNVLCALAPAIDSYAWDVLKAFAHSTVCRLCFEVLSFANGFPPEQAAFFVQYARDIFTSRKHTHSLVNLIKCVDEPLPFGDIKVALSHLQRCTVISGYFDFITGVYHSHALIDALQRPRNDTRATHGNDGNSTVMTVCEHVVCNMGSHFVLLEWPDLVAARMVYFMNGIPQLYDVNDCDQTACAPVVPNKRFRSADVAVNVEDFDVPFGRVKRDSDVLKPQVRTRSLR